MIGYKFVTDDLRSEHGDVQWQIGKWKKQHGKLKLCENGFHASKEPIDSLTYFFGSRWFVVEARGKTVHDKDKFVAEEMRLVKEIPVCVLVRFCVDCAKHVLPFFERKFPDDKRPRETLEAVEAWLKKPTEESFTKCKVVARAAAGPAWAISDVGDAARAAWIAARAAWIAARAAWIAARAAWDAAGDAARAAWDAAGAAARAAAWDAAGDARNVEGLDERKWQSKHLKQLIKEA